MQGQNEYDQIAHLYDRYVQVDIDIGFFQEVVGQCQGPVLELMAGTGRVSEAISDCSARLTCVDISREMLRRLSRRFAGGRSRPGVVCADVRSLPLDDRYQLAIIPFNSFMELTTSEDQRQTLVEINRVLTTNGEFICTLHNPKVRAPSLDGEPRLLGSFPIEGDQRFELWVKGTLDQATRLAQSRQEFLVFDKSDRLVGEYLQEVQFALITEEKFRTLCSVCGFEILRVVGNYDGSPYEPDSSPFMIYTLRKTNAA